MVEYLLDTCFIFHHMEREKELLDFCNKNKVGITSFNIEELEYNLKHMNTFIKTKIRNFLKIGNFEEIKIDVHPGNPSDEKNFVEKFDKDILKIIVDPSDAVLLVAGLKSRANILTRDKHHLFTTNLENYLNGYGIQVLNGLPK
jgi:hypothetical protein